AKTLFATHYHELNEMTTYFPRIKNYNVSVKEVNNKIIFLRKLQEGGSEHSFGIHVARMAGMPKQVVDRANDILKKLEKDHELELSEVEVISSEDAVDSMTAKTKSKSDYQLSFFQLNDPVLEQVKDELVKTDINTLTPVEALMKLNDIKRLIGG
ncbi:MAG: DNA mismatch repair protein MutS, partial [Bacteroidetes bacterium]|nr:DNA mismatch repair protein MutS [Bacteroidota bacterium]